MTIPERLDHPSPEGEHLGLAINRESYKIDQHRTVEIRVGVAQPDVPGSPVEPWFQCVTCDYLLFYFEDRGLFECGECGYSMSKAEAIDLCEVHAEYVKALLKGFLPPSSVEEEVVTKAKKRWYFLWLW